MNTFDRPILELMSRDVVTVHGDEPVRDVAKRLAAHRIGAVVVTDKDGEITGIFTERDLLRKVVSVGLDSEATAVREVMTANPIVLDHKTPIASAFQILDDHGFRHMPVTEGDRLIGIASLRDLFRLRLRQIQGELEGEVNSLRQLNTLLSLSVDERAAELLNVNRRLQQLALTDDLTGLYNARYFRQRLPAEIARAKRHKTPLSLVFGDLDRFKRVNDTWGHAAGDVVLKKVAQLLRNAVEGDTVVVRLRRSDIVARYGGEEFAVILPMTWEEDAAGVAERVRLAIEATPIALDDGNAIKITMSFGVASAQGKRGFDDLLERADSALYEAKETGRNRVVAAGS